MSTTKIKFKFETENETIYNIRTGAPKIIQKSFIKDEKGLSLAYVSNEYLAEYYEDQVSKIKIMAMAPEMLEVIDAHCSWLIAKRDELSYPDDKIRADLNKQIDALNEICIKYYSHLKKA